MQSRAKQQGAAMMLIIIGIIIVLSATLTSAYLSRVQGKKLGTYTTTNNNLETVRKALVLFAQNNGRLPCPANGAQTTGLAVPAAATQNCTNTNGVVPWTSLGIPPETALDGWSRKISYRVYQGAAGLTNTNGADATKCDNAPATPVAPAATTYPCTAAHNVSGNPASSIGFFSSTYRPGLVINNAGTTSNQIAFALISHGESGYGAWVNTTRMTMPSNANTEEFGNTGAAGTYYIKAVSDPTVAPSANNHYDDVVVSMSIYDLITQAGRGPRNWAASTPLTSSSAAVTVTGPLLTAAQSFTGQSSRVSLITLTPANMTTNGGGAPAMVISTDTSHVIAMNAAQTALGVCAPAPAVCNDTTAQIAPPEYLSFRLTLNTAQRVSLGLLNYGAGDTLQVDFRNNGSSIGTQTITYPTVVTDLIPLMADTSNGNKLIPVPDDASKPKAQQKAAPFNEIVITASGTNTAFMVQSLHFCDYDLQKFYATSYPSNYPAVLLTNQSACP